MRAAGFRYERGDEVERILDNLRRIIHVLYGHSRRVERLARLTSPQAWMITALSRKESSGISDLARAMHLSPSAVVRIVTRLEDRGLVTCVRPSNDQRIVKVTLTHVGRKLAGRIPAIPQELLLKGLSEIPPNRLRAISENLDSLTRILGAEEATPRLFFAPVTNLPTGGDFDEYRIALPLPEAEAPAGKGGTAAEEDPRKRRRDMIRKTYIRKVEDHLARLEADIDRLRDRMAAPAGGSKDRIDREFTDLRSKAQAVRKAIRSVEAAGATNWGRLKNAVDDGLKELGQAIDQALEKVRNTGSGGR